MTLAASLLDELAGHLETCQREARDTLKITESHPTLGWDEAYAIQDRILARKRARRPRGGLQGRPDLARQDAADGRDRARFRLSGR